MNTDVPENWDDETDFLSVGSGIGGLSGAIAADAWGLRAMVVEKAATVGGVTSYSGGQLWAPANYFQEEMGSDDTIESGLAYIKATSAGLSNERMALNYVTHARVALQWFRDNAAIEFAVIKDFPDYYYPKAEYSRTDGRYIESGPYDARVLGEWQDRAHLSTQMMSGLTQAETIEHGGLAQSANWDRTLLNERVANDIRTFGPGLGANFVKATLDRGIPILTGTRVDSLIVEDGQIVGVQATRDGRDHFIKVTKGVLLATGAYDWNETDQSAFTMIPNVKAVGPREVTGDALRIAGRVGGRITQVPQALTTAFQVTGDDGESMWRLGASAIGVPHAIAVNRHGRRFAEESFYRSMGFALKDIDGSTMEFKNYPFWAIQDSSARTKYPLGPFAPGQELPEGFAVKADTLRELAVKVGIDPDGLEDEVRRFNGFVESGVDEDFHRGERPWSALNYGDSTLDGNQGLGAIETGPFYAIRMEPVNIGLSNVGLAADTHNRVLSWDDEPIEGLYVAGNSMAMVEFGAGYTSGQANTRGMYGGYLAARHAAGDPSTLLDAAGE